MVTCIECGGDLTEWARFVPEDGRAFRLFRCLECGAEGGKAWGSGLPEESWGVVEQPNAVANGGVR